MLALLIAIGCNVPKHYSSWDAQLAAAAHETLAGSVDKIDKLSRNDRVAIVNLDGASVEDQAVVPYIEDALVHGLTQSGATVVERDSEGLRGFVQEGSGDKLHYTVTGHSEDANSPMVYDATLSDVGPTHYLVNGERVMVVSPGTTLLDAGPNGGDDVRISTSSRVTNDVMSANKVLEYRIVDVQVRGYTYKGEVYRFTDIVLHMRLVDADYGVVLWTGLVQEVVEDRVPVTVAAKLRK